MEVSLRRRLEGVASISISQSRQTVDVIFADGRSAFSASAFREALAESGIEVVALQLDACGAIERKNDQHWLVAGHNRFLVEGAATAPSARHVCVLGPLDDRSAPYRLTVNSIELGAD